MSDLRTLEQRIVRLEEQVLDDEGTERLEGWLESVEGRVERVEQRCQAQEESGGDLEHCIEGMALHRKRLDAIEEAVRADNGELWRHMAARNHDTAANGPELRVGGVELRSDNPELVAEVLETPLAHAIGYAIPWTILGILGTLAVQWWMQ